ncbi:hypothetical protein CWI42_040560 [Ordospora colligata]|uniref:Uncharacterized protein n=1 Tax=Ordospora colligata OC4 TaxID=1354746 RepID=A0A0B2UKJ1_9MICR|nr:uncharacterized protein M896_040560 [Ordospora colligata OC4]KHN69863.1 hypothetical protein M896_040560 [Ordospora colligata OC4]TBU16033.1 hypothetical protein CWI41_040560 [Ordospora colligata]TBU16246.1 hypothetical protein CWI40_040560 [Ordospora colligata]TBU18950.1 hypothetical protein CWI42_040560 [Ordospora colligata]
MDALARTFLHNIARLRPIVTVGCAISSSYALCENGIDANLSDMLLPGLLMFFGPGLCANIVYKEAKITRMGLVSYFIGVAIFSMFSRMRILKPATAIFPVIGRGLMYVGLKNNKHPFHLVVGWLLAIEISVALIQKMLFNKKMRISGDKMGETFFLIAGLGVGRLYRLPNYTMMVMVALISVGPLMQTLVSFTVSNRQKKSSASLSSPSSSVQNAHPKVKVAKRKTATKPKNI